MRVLCGSLVCKTAGSQHDKRRNLVAAGAGISIAERDLTPERLAQELNKLLSGGREQLEAMAMRARSVAITDADVRLADACVAAAGGVA